MLRHPMSSVMFSHITEACQRLAMAVGRDDIDLPHVEFTVIQERHGVDYVKGLFDEIFTASEEPIVAAKRLEELSDFLALLSRRVDAQQHTTSAQPGIVQFAVATFVPL